MKFLAFQSREKCLICWHSSRLCDNETELKLFTVEPALSTGVRCSAGSVV